MRYRVDFALIEAGKIIAELTAAGDSLEQAIFSAATTVAPHLADGRTLAVVGVGYLCACGSYHPVGHAVEAAVAAHVPLPAEAVAN